jgi:transcriptional regulator with XRE-family HTH domain
MLRIETPLGEYLRARRALVQPEDVGLPRTNMRRVAGLRRDEVAALAGISQEYYLRLEQGRDRQPSPSVTRGLAHALQLDSDALEYMERLTQLERGNGGVPDGNVDAADRAERVQPLLDRWSLAPAYVMDVNQDIIAANALATGISSGLLRAGANVPLLVFRDEARAVDPDWEETASLTLATLRFRANPRGQRFRQLLDQLSGDPDFRRLWRRHDARPFWSSQVRRTIASVGVVGLRRETFILPGPHQDAIITLFADVGSLGEEAIDRLRSKAPRVGLPTLV